MFVTWDLTASYKQSTMSGCQLLEISPYDLARTCAVQVHNLFQVFLLSASDVDQGLSYHQANAGAAPVTTHVKLETSKSLDSLRSSLDFARLAIVFTVVRVV